MHDTVVVADGDADDGDEPHDVMMLMMVMLDDDDEVVLP